MQPRAIRAAYLAAAAFIVLGPALPQLTGIEGAALRSWKMFTGVGMGMLRGTFTVTEGGVETARESPLEFFGRERYPVGDHYRFDRLVYDEADLARVAAPRCAELAPGAVLSFEGELGVREGWAPFRIADICGAGE